jgi:ABC-type antimicrobial peptide transport system permease subunit
MHIGVPSTALPWMTVVGEIGDIKQGTPDAAVREQMYQPAGQFKTALGPFARPEMLTGSYGSIVLRASLPPEQLINALQSTVRSIDARLPLTQVESMDQVINEGEAPQRFNTILISSFAVAAVLLALIGIYSVIAFSAALRTQEMAIRLALGSQRGSVARIILISGAKLGLAGCAIGAVGAYFATRLLRSMLFQVNPLDPMILTFATLAIFLLAVAACLIPARRAAFIDPMQALRGE